jgi:sugar porter (SP) family MFS transporter
LVALAQFNIVLGILLAYVSNYAVTLFGLGAAEWRWMFGVEALPAAMFILLLFGNPCSPRWLMAKGRKQDALDVLCQLEGNPKFAQKELLAIQESLDLEHHKQQEPFYTRKYLKPILLACTIAAFNQLSGINALIYYAPKIFKMTGAAGENALLQSVIIGLVNLVFTMAALAVIDHFGRKKLMLVGSVGYIFSLGLASYAFFTNGEQFTRMGGLTLLGAMIVFIASHAFGQGAVVWVFISEIFPNRVRARGQATGCFTVWVFNAVVSQTFPMIAGRFGGGAIFAVYCGFMVLQLMWVIFLMPETKGVPLEDIQKQMGID